MFLEHGKNDWKRFPWLFCSRASARLEVRTHFPFFPFSLFWPPPFHSATRAWRCESIWTCRLVGSTTSQTIEKHIAFLDWIQRMPKHRSLGGTGACICAKRIMTDNVTLSFSQIRLALGVLIYSPIRLAYGVLTYLNFSVSAIILDAKSSQARQNQDKHKLSFMFTFLCALPF